MKYWLSTLAADIGFDKLVDMTKLRWSIERDYRELKQELGLGHYEGRGWRGFHHHATLYGDFLVKVFFLASSFFLSTVFVIVIRGEPALRAPSARDLVFGRALHGLGP